MHYWNTAARRRGQRYYNEKGKGMSGTQLYLAIGLPSFVALAGILLNVGYFVFLNGRMIRVGDKLDALTGKVAAVVNRVVRIEDKLGIVPR